MGLDEESMINRLKKSECPVFWKLDYEENTKASMYDKLATKNEEIGGQVWRHIVLELAMCYEWQKTAAFSCMLQKLQECLSTVNNAQESSFIKKYEAAFLHLILTTKAFVAIRMTRFSEAARAIQQVVNLNEMSDPERAAVYGIKANVFAEYGIAGTREAFVWVREAIKLDGSEPEWHFLLGKLHARQRHYALLREPSAEEIASLERAYEGLKRPHTAVYLADCCAERAKLIFYKQPLVYGKREISKEDDLRVKELNRKAMKLYDEARELNQNQCLHIMIRCARGFAILPGEFRNEKMAQELAEKAASPEGGSPDNPMLSAVFCMIYKNHGELKSAILHAKRSAQAGAFGSHIRLMNLYHTAKWDFDVDACINRALEEFPCDVYKLQLYIYGSVFFLFAKKDLFKSLPYFEKAVELDPKFNLLQDRYVRWVKVYLNIYELMFNEIQCAITKETYVSDNEREMLVRVGEKIRAAWPSVVDMTIRNDLIGKLRENRFPARGRPRTRSNKKGMSKGKGKRNMNSKKRLKSALSTTEHSEEPPSNHQIRSASDDRLLSSKRHVGPKSSQFGPKTYCKRALSHDGRSQSREDRRRKILKEMVENVRKSVTDLTLNEGESNIKAISLKPQMSGSMWGAGGAKQGSSNLELSMSRLSLDNSSSEKKLSQKGKIPSYYQKRSVSFDRQLQPQKKTTAEATNRKFDDRFCFMPDFKKPAGSVQYGSLTVENVERLKNMKVSDSRESLDSDDTQESRMSSASVQRESNETRSISSVSLTTKRSVSLDEPRSVPRVAKSGESDSWYNICDNDPYCAFDIDPTPVRQPNAKLVCADRRQASRSPRASHGQSLSDRMRDLSLEKKPDSYSNASQQKLHRQTGGPGRPSFQDRHSSFGRKAERVLMPPGARRQRSESETSASSVDSDYIGSRWSNSRACAKYRSKN